VTDIDTGPYRTRLEEERARLVHAVGFLEGENPGSLSDETGEIAVASDNHMADVASGTYDRELDGGLEEGAQQTLHDIENALRKIEDGSYGVCEVCGEPIGAGRLSAIPWARLCIADQRKQDG
jgi:RNA polymerase-binding transcription factor DksA